MSVHRRLGTAAGAVLLTLTVAGCSDLGRTAVGTITYETGHENEVMVTSPSVKGCHELGPDGARKVENETLVDIIMYPTESCRGEESVYVPANSGNEIVPGTPPWRSYSVVH
ncbi:hypothetical protein GPZ77_08450 [Streptomyces sp. QHH-9511]|uniref:hypothetical protein n=1 Tax=Streptomyces sp. QHH-9511 TaxID=2684468 RepID=UPI001318E813|nr:hypothetical protein [Streptomyces sp. QHH-9511]QGZ48410.1 hypothetical protein GPZ77_08450 [Streptomyces sp. QHH-9511]